LTERRIKALLLDLDDTLLINDMGAFAPHYYRALLASFDGVCPPGLFLEALQAGMRAMLQNDGSGPTNEVVFSEVFCARSGLDRASTLARFARFYSQEFDKLAVHTQADPDARRLVELAFAEGYQVAIATQPVFPRKAILTRLRWAQVPAEEYAYDYVSSYEVLAACKPSPLYFETIVRALGRAPEKCLMVGDSPSSDLPAQRVGLRTFWVSRRAARPLLGIRCDAQGTLGDLIALLQTGRIHAI